ncbi:MAG: hypothetical protein ACR2I2_20370 [Bryobacteraceae bacterium]
MNRHPVNPAPFLWFEFEIMLDSLAPSLNLGFQKRKRERVNFHRTMKFWAK